MRAKTVRFPHSGECGYSSATNCTLGNAAELAPASCRAGRGEVRACAVAVVGRRAAAPRVLGGQRPERGCRLEDVAIDHLFPPYTGEKGQALKGWFQY